MQIGASWMKRHTRKCLGEPKMQSFSGPFFMKSGWSSSLDIRVLLNKHTWLNNWFYDWTQYPASFPPEVRLDQNPNSLSMWLVFFWCLVPPWSYVGATMSIISLFQVWPQFSSVQFSRSVLSDSLRPHELQHIRPPCPSPTPRVHSNSCPSSRWCHPAISSSLVPFSSCPQSLPAPGAPE